MTSLSPVQPNREKTAIIMSPTLSALTIDAQSLAKKIGRVIILDCRFSLADTAAGQQNYDQGHIPGAHYCDLDKHLSGSVETHGGRHPLPTSEQFVQQLYRWGITEHSEVVVYDDQKMAFASRAWWLLNVAGIHNVRVLDGGYQAWLLAGHAKDRRKPAEKHNDYRLQSGFNLSNTHSFEAIVEMLSHDALNLIDSREPARYRGESEPIDPIAGHIPTAQNLPWNDVTNEAGYIQPQSFHQERWSAFADTPTSTVIYCGSGVTACVNLLSSAIAGHEFSIYPGSWSDWISHEDAPIATSN